MDWLADDDCIVCGSFDGNDARGRPMVARCTLCDAPVCANHRVLGTRNVSQSKRLKGDGGSQTLMAINTGGYHVYCYAKDDCRRRASVLELATKIEGSA